jgi:hypothetical protein
MLDTTRCQICTREKLKVFADIIKIIINLFIQNYLNMVLLNIDYAGSSVGGIISEFG